MPEVGKGSKRKTFGYDAKGRLEAKKYAKATQQKVVNKKPKYKK